MCDLKKEDLDILADALEALDTQSRDIVLLFYAKNKSVQEIADGLGISYTYANLLLKKAEKFLLHRLEEQKSFG